MCAYVAADSVRSVSVPVVSGIYFIATTDD